jgi:hypothetical protein
MEYSRPLPGPPGHNRSEVGYYSQLAEALLGRRDPHPGHPRRERRTEGRSRRGPATGSPHRNQAPDIQRHAGRYLGVDLGPRTASVPIARLARMGGVPPEIAAPQVVQSCGKLLRRMGRSGPRPPYGPTTTGRPTRHAGRASPLGGPDSLSGDRARLEGHRKSDATYPDSRPTQDCRAGRSNPTPRTAPALLPENGLESPLPTPAWQVPALVSR